ncbi:MAG: ferrous iron transport protein A [Propionibacteriaceae bacterium]|jgi:Fe2+ transport system protein FeoA|nr:ferrous iron transport protein A [Propionibacteriaceae bacterium]
MRPAVTISLEDAPLRRPLMISNSASDPVAAGRLSSLGWRLGVPLLVLAKAAGGARVVDLGGSRVAIGHALAGQLQVELVG